MVTFSSTVPIDFFAERGGIGEADGLVRGLVVDREVLLALHLERAIGILRERDATNDGAFVIVRLAMDVERWSAPARYRTR